MSRGGSDRCSVEPKRRKDVTPPKAKGGASFIRSCSGIGITGCGSSSFDNRPEAGSGAAATDVVKRAGKGARVPSPFAAL